MTPILNLHNIDVAEFLAVLDTRGQRISRDKRGRQAQPQK